MQPINEFDLIERFFTRATDDDQVVVGIGDDAAVIRCEGRLAVAVDTLVSGVHFPIELAPHAIGHRALAVNLSDLAAVGAEPRWATLALTLPAADEDWLAAFAAGFFELAARAGVSLIGGDTTRGPLAVTVQAMGPAPPADFPARAGGRAGDDLFVSETLGDAAAGVAALAHGLEHGAAEDDRRAALIRRFAYPEPRLALGRALAGLADAAIDISDGLTADLGHICRQSGLGAALELDALPLSEALVAVHGPARAREFALTGGDDYELCFAAPTELRERVAAVAASSATPVTRIGRLSARPGLRSVIEGRESPLPAAGYRHF